MTIQQKEGCKILSLMMGFILGVICIAGCSNQIAYADKLAAGAIEEVTDPADEIDPEQERLQKLAEADGYDDIDKWLLALANAKVDFVNTTKEYQLYKDFLKEKQYQILVDNKIKAKASESLNEIEQLKEKSYNIAKEGKKKLNITRKNARTKVNKYFKLYKKYLTTKQKEQVQQDIQNINASYSKTKIAKYAENGKQISLKGKRIKSARSKYITKVKNNYKKYKTILSTKQQNKIKKYKTKIGKSYNISNIKKYYKNTVTIVNKAKKIPGIDTSGWSVDKIKFVKAWGVRNNKYLAGHGMAGTGYHIARAAYEYGMEPRLCAAISRIESGCGDMCCGNHNAWGWIWPYTYSFSSWEEGINKWTARFAPVFGKGAPTWNHGYCGYSHLLWLREMNKI